MIPLIIMTFQTIYKPYEQHFPQMLKEWIESDNSEYKEEIDWFKEYSLYLPKLELIVSEGVYENKSCDDAEIYIADVVNPREKNYGYGLILANAEIPFGIVKGNGDWKSFISAYNLLDQTGNLKVVRGGIYRINEEIQNKLVPDDSRTFKLLDVDKVELTFDRMIIPSLLSIDSKDTYQKLDNVIAGAASYLKTGEGNYQRLN